MNSPLESLDRRATDPVVGIVLIVGLAVLSSATLGTFLIGVANDLEPTTAPQATVEVKTVVADGTDGFVTVSVDDLSNADYVELRAMTTDGTAAIADGDGTTAELTQRSDGPDSITIRKSVDSPRDVTIRLVAVAHGDDRTTTVLERTVIV